MNHDNHIEPAVIPPDALQVIPNREPEIMYEGQTDRGDDIIGILLHDAKLGNLHVIITPIIANLIAQHLSGLIAELPRMRSEWAGESA